VGSPMTTARSYFRGQYFERSESEAVAYLRSHAGYQRFLDFYRQVRTELSVSTAQPSSGSPVTLPLLLGRHMRLAPEPPWVAIWRSEDPSDLDTASETLRRSSIVTVVREETWESILDKTPPRVPMAGRRIDAQASPLYYIEWLSNREYDRAPDSTSTREQALIRRAVAWDASHSEDLTLLLARTVSARNEPSRYVSIRRIQSLARLDLLRAESEPVAWSCFYRTFRLETAGIYTWFAQEQL
jgi:hypothetical protein